jgi:uncharacterized protein (DUF1697 family)
MPQYIALLRGINVGGHRVKMDRLRMLFEDLDLRDVSTFIASGNVVFSTESVDVDGLRDAIERHLERELGYEVATFLRTPAQLAQISALDPTEVQVHGESYPSHYVIFLHAPAPESLRSELESQSSEMDTFQFSGLEIHWRIRGKLSESRLFGAGLDRATRGIPTTTRNMNTLRRLVAKTSPPAESRDVDKRD